MVSHPHSGVALKNTIKEVLPVGITSNSASSCPVSLEGEKAENMVSWALLDTQEFGENKIGWLMTKISTGEVCEQTSQNGHTGWIAVPCDDSPEVIQYRGISMIRDYWGHSSDVENTPNHLLSVHWAHERREQNGYHEGNAWADSNGLSLTKMM